MDEPCSHRFTIEACLHCGLPIGPYGPATAADVAYLRHRYPPDPEAVRAQVSGLLGDRDEDDEDDDPGDYESVLAAVAPLRLCACGCGQSVTSPRPEAKYATGACRVRALRQRNEVSDD